VSGTTADLLTLCRTLYPRLVEALYISVKLETSLVVSQFAPSIAHRPERARMVYAAEFDQDASRRRPMRNEPARSRARTRAQASWTPAVRSPSRWPLSFMAS